MRMGCSSSHAAPAHEVLSLALAKAAGWWVLPPAEGCLRVLQSGATGGKVPHMTVW